MKDIKYEYSLFSILQRPVKLGPMFLQVTTLAKGYPEFINVVFLALKRLKKEFQNIE